MKNYRYLQRKYMLNTYPDRELNIIAGEGIYLIDIFGEKYLDLMTNYGVNIFGYSHSHLIQSLTNQLQKLTILHGSFSNDRRAEAAKSLVKRCGGGLAQVYFSNSGSEAVEASLKFAVLATGKMKFISCRSCYHGKT
ncbi:MAG: aminotransferase class III-fold pyridoxal phosphate-dependent enzyme, partial [Candidatus Aminicenantales bacterium]